MTSFARACASTREGGWGVEIRSLNSRYFEFSLKISPSLSVLDVRVREMVQSVMRRGKVSAAISQDSGSSKSKAVSIDEGTVKLYLDSVSKIKKKFKLQGEVTVSDVLRLPGVFSTEESEVDPDKIWPSIKKVLAQALQAAVKSKQTEGAKLAKDVEGRLDAVTRAVQTIEKHAAGQSEKMRRKILDRVGALVSEKTLEPDRLEREVAFLAERVDITEELVRIKAHLDLFKKRLRSEGEIGRELDFLCQEMHREINTMASKSQHFEISTEVVFVKGELEKIREQIQNIE